VTEQEKAAYARGKAAGAKEERQNHGCPHGWCSACGEQDRIDTERADAAPKQEQADLARCSRCGDPATSHAVDDEERRECKECECTQYTAPTCRETCGSKCCALTIGHDGAHVSRSGSSWPLAVAPAPAEKAAMDELVKETQAMGLYDAPALDLAAIEARCNAATPGPWDFNSSTGCVWQVDGYATGDPNAPDTRVATVHHAAVRGVDGIVSTCPPNSAFIAAARADVPRLVQAVRDRDAEIARLRDALDAADCVIGMTHETSADSFKRAEQKAAWERYLDARLALRGGK